MKRIDLKISILLAFVCFIGGFFVVPYQLDSLQETKPEQYELLVRSMPIPLSVLSVISALQIMIISFVLAYIGIKLARKTGFKLNLLDALFKKEKVTIDSKSVIKALIFGGITAFVITASDRFYFQNKIGLLGEMEQNFSLIGLLAGVFYGGVFEEIMLRLLVMSLFVWLMLKLFRQTVQSLPSFYYWVAIIIASLLFAAGHLPATKLLSGELTNILILRCFLLNGIGGIFFGYLYWKKGLEYAIFAHMFTHIAMQIVFIPLFY
ncbi:MAG TPA: CPBP family intramembrane glutamic endopeptidase [Ureibacillus sp.]|nr:CPBP family intramembrane glutamic endopeptidase [Ureibacillus sp.]